MNFLKEYTLLSELGQGGFAKVYKVRHNELGYIRAIRVLNEPVADEKSTTYQKFLRECKVLLRLGNGCHPNIVHIYQPRLLESHALVEMDYVDGTDISHYLTENGRFLPIDEVLRMVEQMSSALAYCHEDIYKFCMDREADQLRDDPMDGTKVLIDETTRQRLIKKYKVIHNDIHSGNIMRRGDGSFVLLDFGLAITGIDDVRNSSRHENGAVEFKAPEKWDDEALLTEQSDVYSFGVVMYEYLAGRVPFPFDKSIPNRTEATFKLSKAHKEMSPPPIFDLRKSFYEEKYPGETYQKDYPDWLEEAIMRCLEKDPAKRFHNGKELHDYVKSHLKEPDKNEEEVLAWQQRAEQAELERQALSDALSQSEEHVQQLTDELKEAKQHASPKRKPWLLIVLLLLVLSLAALLVMNLLDKESKKEEAKKREIQPIPEENADLQREIDSLLYVVGDLRTQNNTLISDKEELQHTIDSLNQQITGLQEQLDNAQLSESDEIIELKGKLDTANKKIIDLESKITKKTDEISRLTTQLETKKNEVKMLNDQLLDCVGKLKDCADKLKKN